MSRIVVFFILSLTSFILKAQVSENREVSPFTNLNVSNSIDVYYTFSKNQSIKVFTDDTQKIKCIKTEVENGTLKIYINTKEYEIKKGSKKDKNGKNWNNGVSFEILKIEISGPFLNEIVTSASAKVTFLNCNETDNLLLKSSSSSRIEGNFKANHIFIKASSSSKCLIQVNSQFIKIDSSSSSVLKLAGDTDRLEVNSSSSSVCDLKDLFTNEAQIIANSSSDVKVNVVEILTAEATSSASIICYGEPKKLYSKERTSGSISIK